MELGAKGAFCRARHLGDLPVAKPFDIVQHEHLSGLGWQCPDGRLEVHPGIMLWRRSRANVLFDVVRRFDPGESPTTRKSVFFPMDEARCPPF